MFSHAARNAYRLWLLPTVTLACLFIVAPALAISAGKYECAVESAVGVTTSGDKITLKNAPQSFGLQAFDAPVSPNDLRQSLRSLENYQPEKVPITSASIDTKLFHSPVSALKSKDERVYTQETNVVVFSDEKGFTAYGLASKTDLDGVTIYTGTCKRL